MTKLYHFIVYPACPIALWLVKTEEINFRLRMPVRRITRPASREIEESGKFEIVASQTANCDRNEAFNVVQNILTSNPDVNVIWAVNAEMGQGAIQAIEQAGKSGISVFDFDGSAVPQIYKEVESPVTVDNLY